MEPIYVDMYQEQCGMVCDMDIIGAYRNVEDAVKAMCEDVRNETLRAAQNPEAICDKQFIPGMELEQWEPCTTIYAHIEDDELSAKLRAYGRITSWKIIKVNGIK